MKSDEWFRSQAEEIYGSAGEIEVDHSAAVSRGDNNGAYVAAWVWVPIDDAEQDEDV